MSRTYKQLIYSSLLVTRTIRNYFVLLVLVMCGCSTTYTNLDSGHSALGGGYNDTVVSEGIYYIKAQTNFAPVANRDGARSVWSRRAKELCGGFEFEEIVDLTREYEYDQITGVPNTGSIYLISVKDGFAVCKSSKINVAEAKHIILEEKKFVKM